MAIGRKPKPARLKLLEGNPGRREIHPEPEPREGLPVMPSWLEGEARRAWRRVIREMGPTGVIRKIDGDMLAIYAHLYGSLVDRLRAGGDHSAPLLAQLRALSTEFGLSPVARARLHAPGKKEVDPLEALLQRRG